jgi:hypothetical protein
MTLGQARWERHRLEAAPEARCCECEMFLTRIAQDGQRAWLWLA